MRRDRPVRGSLGAAWGSSLNRVNRLVRRCTVKKKSKLWGTHPWNRSTDIRETGKKYPAIGVSGLLLAVYRIHLQTDVREVFPRAFSCFTVCEGAYSPALEIPYWNHVTRVVKVNCKC